MAQIAQCVCAGQFQMIKRRLVQCFVGKTFQGFGFCFMKAEMNFPTHCVVSDGSTWAVLCSGDVCVTSTSTVGCFEEPPKGPFVLDGPNVSVKQGQWQYNDVGTIKMTLAFLFRVSQQGMVSQARGVGQCYHQCLEPFTYQQLHYLFTLMANDLHNETSAMGVAMVEHSLHGGFEMPQRR